MKRPPTWRRPPAIASSIVAAFGAVLGGLLFGGGCGLNQEGVVPPSDTIAYPASAVASEDGRWLFVVNSNADLRYNDGTVVVLDLTQAEVDRAGRDGDGQPFGLCPTTNYVNPRTAVPICCVDLLDRDALNCDEKRYVQADRSVRIGSYSAGMVLQRGACPARCACPDQQGVEPPERLLIAVRGDTSLTWIDVERPPDDPRPVLHCTGQSPDDPQAPFVACDQRHRTVYTDGPPESRIRLPDEPYALTLDQTLGLLYVGHLAGDVNRPGSGGISLFDVGSTSPILPPPHYLGLLSSPFAPSPRGLTGVTTVLWDAERPRGNPAVPRGIFATSRYTRDAIGLDVTDPLGCGGELQVALIGTGEAWTSPLVGEQIRGIAFTGPGRQRPFLLQRNPAALVGFDAAGQPAETLETCGAPTFLYRQRISDAVGDRLFVNCQDTGEIYVFDPAVPRLLQTFLVGRGPAGMVFARSPASGRPIAYVVGFTDNNISVVDLEPGSPTEYHVIQRLGFPSTVPR